MIPNEKAWLETANGFIRCRDVSRLFTVRTGHGDWEILVSKYQPGIPFSMIERFETEARAKDEIRQIISGVSQRVVYP